MVLPLTINSTCLNSASHRWPTSNGWALSQKPICPGHPWSSCGLWGGGLGYIQHHTAIYCTRWGNCWWTHKHFLFKFVNSDVIHVKHIDWGYCMRTCNPCLFPEVDGLCEYAHDMLHTFLCWSWNLDQSHGRSTPTSTLAATIGKTIFHHTFLYQNAVVYIARVHVTPTNCSPAFDLATSGWFWFINRTSWTSNFKKICISLIIIFNLKPPGHHFDQFLILRLGSQPH